MHAAACDGNASAFFAYIAEDELATGLVRRKHAPSKSVAYSMVAIVLSDWRRDIADSGRHGNICAWTVVGLKNVGDQQVVEVRARSGSNKVLWFRKINGVFRLVDYESADGSEGTTG
jgi:hypothetical protein